MKVNLIKAGTQRPNPAPQRPPTRVPVRVFVSAWKREREAKRAAEYGRVVQFLQA